MDEGPRLRLGPKVLSLLMDRYNSWNQSVEEFISGIKVSLLPTSIDKVCVHVSFLCQSIVHFISHTLHRFRFFRAILVDNTSRRDSLITVHEKIRRGETCREGRGRSQVHIT